MIAKDDFNADTKEMAEQNLQLQSKEMSRKYCFQNFSKKKRNEKKKTQQNKKNPHTHHGMTSLDSLKNNEINLKIL